jgi:hypothetical protein
MAKQLVAFKRYLPTFFTNTINTLLFKLANEQVVKNHPSLYQVS